MDAFLEGRALAKSHTDDCILYISTLTASSMSPAVLKRIFKSVFLDKDFSNFSQLVQ